MSWRTSDSLLPLSSSSSRRPRRHARSSWRRRFRRCSTKARLKRSERVGRSDQAACVVANSADRANYPRRAYRPAAKRRKERSCKLLQSSAGNSSSASPRAVARTLGRGTRASSRQSQLRRVRLRAALDLGRRIYLQARANPGGRLQLDSPGRRKQLHEDVGRAIELALYPRPWTITSRIWRTTISRSANQAKAVEYLRLAGVQAMARGACIRRCRTSKAALALLESLPREAVEGSVGASGLEPAWHRLYRRARLRGAAGRPDVSPRLRQLCERIGGPQERFAVVWGISPGASCAARWTFPWTSPARPSTTPRNSMIPASGWRLFLMGVTLYYRGDFAGARQQYETALARYDDDRERDPNVGGARSASMPA